MNKPLSLDKSCSLESVLDRLVEQGMVDREKASMVSSLISAKNRKSLHAIEIIASRKWSNQSKPEQVLTLDFLTDWLSEESGMTRYYFDPLKMDVNSCTSVMSYAYAARFNILPVKVTAAVMLAGIS